MPEEQVILVDDNDNPIGIMEKMQAHRKGVLHRAFSIFVFNSKNQLLLQKRASSKYHSGGLWTNTCCSHPRPGEELLEAASRRLMEEMGLQCDLRQVFSFIYRVQLDNNLSEHELDHVLIGKSDEEPDLNAKEAEDWKYLTLQEITKEILKQPRQFTEWFKIALPRLEDYLENNPI